jgi:phosphoribosyl 1,2-cyclic phosphodiesterase
MGLRIASLNSGSNGNCYYIADDSAAILVDVGLPCRHIEKRLQVLSLRVSDIKGIWITHEHGDHVKGLEVFSKKHQIPVYLTAGTLRSLREQPQTHLQRVIPSNHTYRLGTLEISSFLKYHDAAEPTSIIVRSAGLQVGVFTDLGQVCPSLKEHFSNCHAAFLESNFDHVMLERGPYPWHLKQRIRGGHGHLSNNEALQLFANHRAPYMTHLMLAHLSRENNDPRLVQQLFESVATNVCVSVASRDGVSPLWHITGSFEPVTPAAQRTKIATQMTLF